MSHAVPHHPTDATQGLAPLGVRGDLILTASSDGAARVWRTGTGELAITLVGHTDDVLGAAFSSDGRLVATASGDGSARIWNPITGELLKVLDGHQGEVTTVSFSPDNGLIATASADGKARVWSAMGEAERILKPRDGRLYDADYGPGDLVATAGGDGTARI